MSNENSQKTHFVPVPDECVNVSDYSKQYFNSLAVDRRFTDLEFQVIKSCYGNNFFKIKF
jgi:hypothetical protein